jgi:Uma2 family endonuclease
MEHVLKKKLSLEEYNQMEEEEQWRYEYHSGEVFAMAGGDPKHSAIAGSIIYLLSSALRGKGCTPFTSDTKFYIEALNKSLYPDVSVVCRPFERSDKDKHALVNPVLLVEVLSESTADYDRGAKFRYYSKIPSLREYVLVEQNSLTVETRHRGSENEEWKMDWFEGKEAKVVLRSLNIKLLISEIYQEAEGL